MSFFWDAQHLIWQIAINTPWWIYILFAYLLYAGIYATRPHIISLLRLMILPAVLIGVSLHTLLTGVNLSFINVANWSIALLIGLLCGWWQVFNMDIQVDKQRKLFSLPGSFNILSILVLIFIAESFFNYETSLDPRLINQTWFEFSILIVYGLCTGLILGRFLCYWHRLKHDVQTDLS